MTDPSNADDVYHWSYASFTPSEVARITGVSQELQRDWRRRNIYVVKEQLGWTRLFTPQVATVLLRKALMDAGIKLADDEPMIGLGSVCLTERAVSLKDALVVDPGIAPEVVTSVLDERRSWRKKSRTQFLVRRLPEVAEIVSSIGQLLPCDNWHAVARYLRADGGATSSTTVDLHVLASRLAALAEKPLLTMAAGPARKTLASHA